VATYRDWNAVFAARAKACLPVLALTALSGCIWLPTNRSDQESTNPVPLSGYLVQSGDTAKFTAPNVSTNGTPSVDPLTTATASTTAETFLPSTYALYPWSKTFTVPNQYWAPQGLGWNGLATAQGRLEITGTEQGDALDTFSPAAQQCVLNSTADNLSTAGMACSDGKSLVLFDNDGVGNGPETTGLSGPVAGPFTDTLGGDVVHWEVREYTVQGHTVYAAVCHPSTSGLHKTMIINHGDFDGIDALGVTYCINTAHAGWLTAMSSYRGEWVDIAPSASFPNVPTVSLPSSGNIEFCLGEVTDVMRLTEILPTAFPTEVDTTRMVMWGHSHGACVTLRAVEHGVQLAAAAAFSPPTDFARWAATNDNPTNVMLSAGVSCNSSQVLNNDCTATTWAWPSTAPMAYTWRSAGTSTSTLAGDLNARAPDMPVLILHGTYDEVVPVDQSCQLSSLAWGANALNLHFDTSGTAVTTQLPVSCDTSAGGLCIAPPGGWSCPGLKWTASSIPSGKLKPGRYLAVYDQCTTAPECHGAILDPNGKAWQDFAAFVDTAVQ
jgi:hypothetical protein